MGGRDEARVSNNDELREEIVRLGPWHLRIQVNPEMSTDVWLEVPPETQPDYGRIEFGNPRDQWVSDLLRIYPNGLEGRSVLDCACNCGAYLFWVKELGAGRCFGFDVREHWIKQARFLLERREGPKDDIDFAVCDLYDLPSLGLEPFDIVLFNGIFYHVPDPVRGVKLVADLTNELIQISTSTRHDREDGMLVADTESDQWLMYGTHGLNWFPTGPDVMGRILRWAGFPETRLVRSFEATPKFGRMQVVASKDAALLADYKPPPADVYKRPIVRQYLMRQGMVPEQILDNGDRVLAFVRDGADRKALLFTVVKDAVTSTQTFANRRAALEALGLRG
jgi:tRNA (mo5U34)-methyltransferase